MIGKLTVLEDKAFQRKLFLKDNVLGPSLGRRGAWKAGTLSLRLSQKKLGFLIFLWKTSPRKGEGRARAQLA